MVRKLSPPVLVQESTEPIGALRSPPGAERGAGATTAPGVDCAAGATVAGSQSKRGPCWLAAVDAKSPSGKPGFVDAAGWETTVAVAEADLNCSSDAVANGSQSAGIAPAEGDAAPMADDA